MESRITDVGPCEKEIEVTVPPERIQTALDRSYNELRNQVVLPGFRPGRVPRSILERRFGDHVRLEVLQELINESIEEAIKEHQLDTISDPELKPPEGDDPKVPELPRIGPLHFSFTVEVKPEFALPEYRGLDVTRKVARVSEENVATALHRLAHRRAEWQPVPEDAEVLPDDVIVGSITIKAGDETLVDENLVFEIARPIVTPGIRIDEPERLVQDRKSGGQRPITGTVVEDFEKEELRGKRVEGSFELLDVKREVVPPIDDDLAKVHGFDSLEALKQDIRARLQEEHSETADREMKNELVDRLLAQTEIGVGKGAVERVLDRRLGELARRLHAMTGVSEEDARSAAESRREQLRPDVERDTRAWLLIEKVAKREKIFCLEEDVDQAVNRIAAESGAKPSEVRAYYEERGMMAMLRADILEQKTYEFLKQHAKITEIEVDPPAADAHEDEDHVHGPSCEAGHHHETDAGETASTTTGESRSEERA